MIKDTQEYLQHWEKENNPFYPSEMRWDRLQVNRFLKDYKEQLTLTDVSDIVHRAELKVLENVSDYIPCEIYSQAVIFSQKKRDNVR